MKISVVIPSYNRIQFIGVTLKSILNQSFKPFEIILVDDGSSDGTSKMVKEKFPFVKLIYQQNSGVSSARNTGIKAAQGEWVAFLDSDDEWFPEKLENQISTIHKNPGILFYHSNETWIKNGILINQKKKHRKYGGWIFEKCLDICRISPSSVLMHKSIFTKVGLFDENLPICEDYDMWLRVTSKYKIFYSDKVLIKKNGGHSDQLSIAPNGIENYRAYAIEKLLKEKKLNETQLKISRLVLIKKFKIFRSGLLKRGKKIEAKEVARKISFWNDPKNF